MNGYRRRIGGSCLYALACFALLFSASPGTGAAETTDTDPCLAKAILTQSFQSAYDSFYPDLADPRLFPLHKQKTRSASGAKHQNSLKNCTITDFTREGHILSIAPMPTADPTGRRRHLPWSVPTRRAPVQAGVATFEYIRSHAPNDVRHRTYTDFILTAYTVDVRSTGKTPTAPDYGITASGTKANVRRTVAVDPAVIPLGSILYIDGLGWRVAEDTGGGVRGRHIDVLLGDERTAIQFGVKRHIRVYLALSGRG